MQTLLKSITKVRIILQNLESPQISIGQDQIKNAILGGILLTIGILLCYFVFGKVAGARSLIESISVGTLDKNVAICGTLLAGVVFCSAFVKQLYHQHYIDFMPFDSKAFNYRQNEGVLAVSGFLVGVGISWAGGCTFGHAMSGIPRRKFGSLISVIIVSISGYYTNKYKISNKIPSQLTQKIHLNLPNNINSDYYINGCLILPFMFFVIFKDKSLKGLFKYIINFSIGVIFGLGMMIGGMTQRRNVIEMFNYNVHNWNPTIVIVFLTVIVLNFIVFLLIGRNKVTPVFASQTQNPNPSLNIGLILGSCLFGVGWAMGGICPGAFYLMIPLNNINVMVYWGIACFCGIKVGEGIKFLGKKIWRGKE